MRADLKRLRAAGMTRYRKVSTPETASIATTSRTAPRRPPIHAKSPSPEPSTVASTRPRGITKRIAA